MKLYSRILGGGPPVIILHGLFGMSDNWLTIGKSLARENYTIHLLDLRNHGSSPHGPTHRYPDMCEDLLEYMDEKALETAHIIGHSMGGKLAMIFALLHPERLEKLVVVDIAPSDYRRPENTFHTSLIDTLLQIDLTQQSDRGTLRKELESRLHDSRLATFLAKSIDREEHSKTFIWKFNLPVLQKYIQHLYIGLEELELYAPCPVETLFIKGNNSHYYQSKHEADRHLFFPHSRVVGIDGAGHWVHSEQSGRFLTVTTAFLAGKEE